MSIKKAFAVLTVISLLMITVGCGKDDETLKYDGKGPYMSVSSMKIAENSDYELIWDNDGKFVSLRSIGTGEIWSTIPYDYYRAGGTNANLLSPLNITVIDKTSLTLTTVNGYSDCVSENSIKSERIDNGIKVTYYFNNFQISVPLTYTLKDDALKITLDSKEIREGGQFWLVSVSIAPYLCSAENGSENSYVFVPAGNGALLNTVNDARETRKYSCDIYGEDQSQVKVSDLTDDITANLPVFGVKNKTKALFAIIEEGAESVTVDTEVGNKRSGYSGVWATANVRGSDIYSSTSATLVESTMTRVSEQHSETPVSICYYPLTGNNADYNGMAKRYRKYLTDNNKLKVIDSKIGNYGVTIYGGVDISTSFMGIPVMTTKSFTTFSEAKEIVQKLKETSELTPQIKLYGFGENGINSGRIAGGYTFAKVFGSNNDRKVLDNYCKENNISLYYDFDLIRYNASGKGFSYLFGAAKSATLHVAEFSDLLSPIREEAPVKTTRILKRGKIKTAVEKLNRFTTKKEISGISLSTLGEYAYSDFSDIKYFCKNNMASDVSEYIESLRKNSHIVASNANAYAAATADSVYEVPLSNGNYDVFDEEIPFYQLVFCGSKPIFSTEINLSGSYEESLMKAVSSGTGINFALIKNFTPENIQNQSGKFYAAVFENNIEQINQTLSAYSDFYNKIAGVGIERYELLSGGLSKTTFENGVVVYANHTADNADSPVGVLDGYGISVITSGN